MIFSIKQETLYSLEQSEINFPWFVFQQIQMKSHTKHERNPAFEHIRVVSLMLTYFLLQFSPITFVYMLYMPCFID